MVRSISSEDEDDLPLEDRALPERSLKYTSAERLFRLLRFLAANTCTRDDIFGHLKRYYKLDEVEPEKLVTARQAAERMLERDLQFLAEQGFEVKKVRATRSQPARYSLLKGSGPASVFLFTDPEVESLALLHHLFADPAQHVPAHPSQPLPIQSARNPFADDVLHFIEKLSTTLPAPQRKQFERSIKKPFVYFDIAPAANYLPHRETISTIVRAISQRQQIQFTYTPTRGPHKSTFHTHIDPYYVIYMDGHFYLIGYNHQRANFLEYRIDRIQGKELKIQPDMIDAERRRHPVEFRFWIDGDMVKQGLSQRWLSQTPEREEAYLDERGQPYSRVLVRATAYNKWRIIQQLLKYGEKVELVDPPDLRQEMQRVVRSMSRLYAEESKGEE